MFNMTNMFPQGGMNPFAFNTMIFKIDAVHDDTGTKREGLVTVTAPITATELWARKMILDMAYQHGWRMKELDRVDNKKPEDIE